MYLSYGQLEDFLAQIHDVAPNKRTALKGRLKHFQRLGWPEGTNLGKGARVQYDVAQTLFLAVGMEMLQLGLTPERVVDQLTWSGGQIPLAFIESMTSEARADPIYYLFSPESLISLRDDPPENIIRAKVVSRDNIAETIKPDGILGDWRRFAFINMTALANEYQDFIFRTKIESDGWDDFKSVIRKWYLAEQQALKQRVMPR